MIYALDTNIISYLLRGDRAVTARWVREIFRPFTISRPKYGSTKGFQKKSIE